MNVVANKIPQCSLLIFILHLPIMAVVLYCDNKSTLQIATNLILYEKTKNLDIDCHVARERCNSSLMKLLADPVQQSSIIRLNSYIKILSM